MIAIQSKLEDELDLALFAFEQYQISKDTQAWIAAYTVNRIDLIQREYKRLVDLGLTDPLAALTLFQVRLLERRGPGPWISSRNQSRVERL